MQSSRLIAGLILVAVAALMFLLDNGGITVAGAVAMAILGIVMVAISRRE
ncbi:MAG: hypothetical protein H6649_07225 [Caldilineae bacterium]|nr:hypothetical protein [Anaerolineae bacterium]MCB9153831.1 hypothetical protein [Caldilineae bacterium]